MADPLLNHAYNRQLQQLLECNPIEKRKPQPKRQKGAQRLQQLSTRRLGAEPAAGPGRGGCAHPINAFGPSGSGPAPLS